MDDFNYDNEIIEISSDTETTPKLEEVVEIQQKAKKRRKKLKDVWNNLPKNTKLGIIIGIVLVVLLIFGLIIYFIFFNNDDELKEPVPEPVILEKDNYRYEDGKLVFLDKSDKEIGTYECVDKDTEKCYVAKLDFTSDKFDRITSVYETGEEIIKNSQIYLNNLVFVYDEGYISLYNMTTKEKDLKLKTVKAYNTEKDIVVIENEDSEFGVIEIIEEGYDYLIRPSYDNLGVVNNELVYLVAQDKDVYYIVDSNGKKLSENIKADIMSANEEFIVAVKNNTYNVYSYEFEELLSDYDYISLHDKVIALVKSNRLHLKNSNLDKLNEDGIRLENSNYVKKYVYDKDNKLKETKKSYEIEVEENIATITIGEESKEINLLEGAVSSKYNYLNYFDGKLYFYSDEQKEDLLGTYTCTSVNNLLSDEDTLSNCNLYNNENGISGVYNNEYVIIYDNESSTDINYYLYSLREKKIKGTYSSLEIVDTDQLKTNVEQVYIKSLYMIVKAANGTNKGNFGVIEINDEKVAGKVEFKYKNIEKFGDYYLLINVNDFYSVYDKDFNKINSDFSYIKLFDKYYAGIKNGKLNIYEYDNTLGVLENDLTVNSNSFEIDFTDGFEISVDGKNYKYDRSGKEVIEEPIIPDVPTVDDNDEVVNGEEE